MSRQSGEERRRQVAGLVLAADPALAPGQVEEAITAAAAHPAALRSLAAALAADPGALTAGAPPVAGRLVAELIARGSAALATPACARCGRAGVPLTRTESGAMCKPCAARRVLIACAHCGEVKPAASRDSTGQRICERCRRRDRGHRPCGKCGRTASIVVRARDGAPDICAGCYKMPGAVCSVCGRKRECNFAGTSKPVCPSCSPRAAASCARCGQARPPAARWPEGPVCDPCYTAALRNRGRCASCSQQRRLAAPPGGAAADTCADCAGIPVTHACAICGIEDKLYERGRCERCSLLRRTSELLGGDGDQVPAVLEGVRDAIISTATPRTALNWLRGGAGAQLLSGIASGQLACTHQALDLHPQARAAGYLRHVLVAGGALPARDESLARMEAWTSKLLAGVTCPEHRRLLHAYATWQILRRLRRRSAGNPRARTATARPRTQLLAASRFLSWLGHQGIALSECTQAHADEWLAGGPASYPARDFLRWAAEHHRCRPVDLPSPRRTTGTATGASQRWALLARVLHDDAIDLTDRVAGALLLCYGQHLSRIAVMTTSQISRHHGEMSMRFGSHDITVPEPLAGLIADLTGTGRRYRGTGSPAGPSPWLFPGHLPGRPITAARLGERLRAIGIRALPGRRATMLQLAAEVPAAVLADLLHLSPGTATRWTHQAGGDWARYAASLALARDHQD